MARSRNTQKIQVKSVAKFDINSIRIIERKPRQGDIHPLSKSDIRVILTKIPSKFIYKLRTIELLERKSDPGKPWGEYRPSDTKIVLYSHPLRIRDGSEFALSMAFASNRSFSLLAELKEENGIEYSIWTKEMLILFYLEVLAHEIGHHYYLVTKFQKKLPSGKYHELLAEKYESKILSYIDPKVKFYNKRSEKELFLNKLDEFV